jgi:iron complex transport system substrate-binding protein
MTRACALIAVITLPLCAAEPPHRIVSLSPNLTETLYGVGAFRQLVGVSDYSTYPPEVTRLPSVGGWRNPNLEKLVALHPDLIVMTAEQAPFLESKCQDLGFPVLAAADQSLEDIYASILTLGRATGHLTEAQMLLQATRDKLNRLSRRTAAFPKPSVVMIVNRTPGSLKDLDAATRGSFLTQLVEMVGGRVAAPDAKNRAYVKLSQEDLVALNPDVILDFVHGANTGAGGRFKADPFQAWSEMPDLKAVREHRIYAVNQDFVPHASQRIVETAELFARLLHPEAH